MMVPVQCRERDSARCGAVIIIIIGKGHARDQHPKSPLTLVLVLVHRTHLSHQYVYNRRVKISSIVDMFPSCRLLTTALILILCVYSPATTGTIPPRVSQKVEDRKSRSKKGKGTRGLERVDLLPLRFSPIHWVVLHQLFRHASQFSRRGCRGFNANRLTGRATRRVGITPPPIP